MIDLLGSRWNAEFDALVGSCQSSLVLCSPFIGRGPCDRVVKQLGRRRPPVTVDLLTDLSADNLISGATDPVALLALTDQLPGVRLRYLPRLHAKVYVSDSGQAVVTSGNMTDGGLWRNHEYGIRVTDPVIVSRIREDVLGLAELGSPVDPAELRALADVAADLRTRRKAAEASWRAELRKEFDKRLGGMTEDLLRLRVGKASVSAVFSSTILYILRRGPHTTPNIHREVQRIHPDLCDDSIDRVINGQHFGKKWKHAVRTAQVHLRRTKRIVLRGGRWSLVNPPGS